MKKSYFLHIKQFILLLSIFICCNGSSQAQHRSDSLKQAINSSRHDTITIQSLLELGAQYENTVPDTALFYYQEALSIAVNCDNNDFISQCYRKIGTIYHYQGFNDKTIEFCLKSLKISEELDDKGGIASCFNILGIAYGYLGLYNKSSDYFFKSLSIAEELGDKSLIANCYNNLGIIFHDQGFFDNAIEYYLKSLEINKELSNKPGIASCYNNIGTVYYDDGASVKDVKEKTNKYNKVIEYFLKSLGIAEEIGNKRIILSCYNNMGQVYENLGTEKENSELKEIMYNKAIEYYNKSLCISTEIDDKSSTSFTYVNIASLNIKLAGLSGITEVQRQNNFSKAIEYGKKSMTLADEINAFQQKNHAANILMDVYTRIGKYKLAVDYADIYIATLDSLFKEEKTMVIQEMTTKYKTEKQKQQIKLLEEENRTKQQKIRAHNYLLLSLTLLFVIIIGFAYSLRQKAKQRLHQMENELQKYMLLIKNYNDASESESQRLAEKYDLTERETEVLELLCHGTSYARIANNIFVSTNTVKYHIKNIYLKLDVKNKIEALNKLKSI
ncbi:MAG: LuxR family transcriptional regulator [Bacteroidota bacterium]